MTRKKYCHVCGAEQVRGWGRKQKLEPTQKKKYHSSKRRKVINLLLMLIHFSKEFSSLNQDLSN
ncbi:MAG: hypothetical protein GNW80_10905 [Asgard group archaeon]|nr:hypothetical protein [Asgard group archaeon]